MVWVFKFKRGDQGYLSFPGNCQWYSLSHPCTQGNVQCASDPALVEANSGPVSVFDNGRGKLNKSTHGPTVELN